MPKSRILGIDPGFANTGIVGLELNKGHSKVIYSDLVRTQPSAKKKGIRKTSDVQRRHRELYTAFIRAYETVKPDVVSFESVSFVRNSSIMCNIGGAWYGIYYLMLYHGTFVVDYTPTELKVIATGKKTSTKEAMIKAAEDKWFGQIDWSIVTKSKHEHIADAAWAAYAAQIDQAIPWSVMK